MMQNREGSKGITLISMILAVIVLMIIMGTIAYSSRDSFQVRSLQNLFSDVEGLNDAVSVYYTKNKILPVYSSYYDYNSNSKEYGDISIPNTYNNSSKKYFFGFKEEGRDSDTKSENIFFGILDINKIKPINLNEKNNLPDNISSGKFFQPKSGESDWSKLQKSIQKGIFVVNLSTHRVYYTKGISSEGKKYYARNVYSQGANYVVADDTIKVPNMTVTETGKSVDDIILSQGGVETKKGAITVKFSANGGSGAPINLILTEEMLKNNAYLKNYITTDEPTKTGMNFKGWALSTGDTQPLYAFNKTIVGGQTNTTIKVNGDDIRLPSSKYGAGSTITLYAIWEVKDSILTCYYPDDTGGIKPSISNYVVSRTSNIPDGVSNYLCVDIESSGYTVSWTWDNNKNDEKEAIYDGTRKIDITHESRYTTTEPGTVKLKGSFTNLTVSIENGDKYRFKINEADVLTIYNTELSMKRRDKVGSKLATEWLAGNNRAFTIPENITSYSLMGVVDPVGAKGSREYADKLDTSSLYYLKKMVLVENNSNISNAMHDYENDSYYLGTVAELPDENKKYSIYPYFASKNYRLTSSNTANAKKYYYDNLQEAYDSSVELKEKQYNTIKVLQNVKYAKNLDISIYEDRYDPACTDIVKFTQENDVTLDCTGYWINRKKGFEFGKSGNVNSVTLLGNSSSGLNFESNNDSDIILKGNVTFKIDGGCKITSNNTRGNVVDIRNNAILAIKRANIENTSTSSDIPTLIKNYSVFATVCLGCESSSELSANAANKDNDVILKSSNGYVLDVDKGKLYWNYGTLYTKKLKYKCAYTAGTEEIVNTVNKTREPCIYRTASSDYVTKLETRLWEFYDEDSGSSRVYYANNLYNAHDMYNLGNKNISTKTFKFTKNTMQISGDTATITKNLILDYNTTSSNYITSYNGELIIKNNLSIKNCFMNLNCSKDGITVGENLTVDVENSNINFVNSASGRYCIRDNGIFNLKSNATIRGNSGIYVSKNCVANIYGKVDTKSVACINQGVTNINSGASLSSSEGYTINNQAKTIVNGATLNNTSQSNPIIYNTSEITINGTTMKYSRTGVANSGGTCKISNTSINYTGSASGKNAMAINSGSVDIAENSGSMSGDIVVSGGTFTMGNNNSNVGSAPILSGKVTVTSSNGKFNYYDGKVTSIKIISTNNPANAMTGFAIPAGYHVDYQGGGHLVE